VAAGDADVLVHRRVAVDRRLLWRHDAVGHRIQAAHRHRQRLALTQLLGARLHHVRIRPERMRNQPVQRLHERR